MRQIRQIKHNVVLWGGSGGQPAAGAVGALLGLLLQVNNNVLSMVGVGPT